jgi:hypothetical protein
VLTPLQEWLIALRLLIEDAREDLAGEDWRAFVWISADAIGIEAAKLDVSEAVEATEEDAAA